MDESNRLHRVAEHLADVRVSVGRLEAMSDETRRWIDAHRARTTQIEQVTTQRFDHLHARIDTTDRRLVTLGHELALTQRQVAQNKDQLICLLRGRKMQKTLEIGLPLALVAAALAYKIPLTDIVGLIK